MIKKISRLKLLCIVAFLILMKLCITDVSFAAKAWDGKSIDVRWFDEKTYDQTKEYIINTPEELMGLAAIVNGIYNPGIKVIGDENNTKIVKSGIENVEIIPFDHTYGNVYFGKYDFDGKTIKLNADLDMGGIYDEKKEEWSEESPQYMPIGGSYSMENNKPYSTLLASSFNGNFEGNGHKVENIYFDRYTPDHFGFSQGLGLIGAMGANSRLNSKLKEDGKEIIIPDGSTVSNVKVGRGYMNGRRMMGGIVGRLGETKKGIKVIGCSNAAEIVGSDKKGIAGIVGAFWDEKASIEYCYNTGDIMNKHDFVVGGIAGYADGKIRYCYNAGNIYPNKDKKKRKNSEAYGIGSYSSIDAAKEGYASNCYWKEDKLLSKGINKYSDSDLEKNNCSMKTESEMKSKEFANLLNSNISAFKYNDSGMPKLVYEERGEKVKVEIDNNIEGIKITNEINSEVDYGMFIHLKAEVEPGKIIDYYTVNGEKIEGDVVIADRDIRVSAVIKDAKSFPLEIPKFKEYAIKVLKTGIDINENGEFERVYDKEVKSGDLVYEGDDLQFEYTVFEEFYSRISHIKFNATGVKQYYLPDWQERYKVLGTEQPVITTEAIKAQIEWDLLSAADFSWYNPEDTVFEIKNQYELAGLAKILNNKVYNIKNEDFKGKTIKLTSDIRLRVNSTGSPFKNLPWAPMGKANAFAGVFDGNGYRISGMNIYNANEKGMGLFANLIGTEDQPAVIKNLTVDGEILVNEGGTPIGGVVGYTENAILENVKSFAETTVATDSNIGGIVGTAVNTQIKLAENKGTISSKYGNVGGIAGYLDDKSSIDQARNTGNIYQGPILDSKNGLTLGGIVGENKGRVNRVSNTGTITGHYWTGGIIGRSYKSIENAYSTGNVISLGSSSAESSIGTVIANAEKYGEVAKNVYSTGKLDNRLNITKYSGFIPKYRGMNTNANNSYCLDKTVYSENEILGVEIKSEEEFLSTEFLRTMGAEFSEDKYHINNGYPVLEFENGWIENTSIEDLRNLAKKEIQSYPFVDNYTAENWERVKNLIEEYENKFEGFTNETSVESDKIRIREIVEEFKQELKNIEVIEIDEEEIILKNLKSVLESSLTKLSNNLLNPKLPKGKIMDKRIEEANKLIEEGNKLYKDNDATDIQIREILKKIYDLTENTKPDNEAPKIFGTESITINLGDDFNPYEGVQVTDNYLGADSPKLHISGDFVDTKKPGKYLVIYTATDSAGNSTKVERVIIVEGTATPDDDIGDDSSDYDLNKDGLIDSHDAYYLLDLINNNEITEDNMKIYDYDDDGQVDISDVNIILNNAGL
ncbi:MAG: DUF5011 domain-containing protein [Andreesenia angusta]|nr:DUF5011 domain-containing protein [Andreesenia angusta]